MSPGRTHPGIVMDVQVLVSHANRVTIMARERGHLPRIIRGPDVCYLTWRHFHQEKRDELDDRLHQRGTRSDGTTPDRCAWARGDDR